MYILKKIKKICEVFLEGAMAILLAAMVVTVFANVCGRFIFKYSIYWSEEIPRWCLVWMCFLGAAYAYIKDLHMGLDLFTNALKGRWKRGLKIITTVVMLAVFVIIVQGGLEMTVKNYQWISTATGITYSVLYVCTVISGVILVVAAICKLVAAIVSFVINEDWNPFEESEMKGGE